MLNRTSIKSLAALVTLMTMACGAWAHDESKYPDFSGQWRRVGPTQWDPGKPPGLGQQAPLTPEYQGIYEASLAAQAGGGHGSDLRWTCRTSGMPRIMTAVYPIEIIVQPTTTYILSEYVMPRRIYTDGRTRPEIVEPAFAGYSVGKWIDEYGDGRYDVLEVETTHMKGPRDFDVDGLPLHKDNQTVIKERIFLDKANPDLLHDEITDRSCVDAPVDRGEELSAGEKPDLERIRLQRSQQPRRHRQGELLSERRWLSDARTQRD